MSENLSLCGTISGLLPPCIAQYPQSSFFYIGRIHELSVQNERMKLQLQENEKNLSNMQRTIDNNRDAIIRERIESAQAAPLQLSAVDGSQQPLCEVDAMHEALRRIAQEVINDCDQSMMDDSGNPELSTSVIRSSSPLRSTGRAISPRRASRSPRRSGSRSPTRARSPSFADSTFSAVQAALQKRQLQVSELRAKLNATKDQGTTLKRQLDDVDNERRRLEQALLGLREERDAA